MIDDVERYKNTTKQIQCHNEKIIGSFNLFIRLYSVIVGGAI